jgi:hypothetical protein
MCLSLVLVVLPVLQAAPAIADQIAKPQVSVLQPKRPTLVRRPMLERVFELTSYFGDRDVVEITLGGPGTVTIEATWQGSAERLAVILNGPGQTGYYARQDGSSPLSIRFDVTSELFKRGAIWTVSIVNFSRSGRAVGRLVVDYPISAPANAALSPALRRLRDAAIATPQAPVGGPERSILSDGRVQVRYPDGRVVIYSADCGSTTILPDGMVTQALCSQVQPATLPALPSDPALRIFLESHRDRLLQHISQLVDHRQSEIDLYLAHEMQNAEGLLGQIQMRTRLIDNLLR